MEMIGNMRTSKKIGRRFLPQRGDLRQQGITNSHVALDGQRMVPIQLHAEGSQHGLVESADFACPLQPGPV